jgi:two-component system phosphate regulon sensor histidine kinase PhoR
MTIANPLLPYLDSERQIEERERHLAALKHTIAEQEAAIQAIRAALQEQERALHTLLDSLHGQEQSLEQSRKNLLTARQQAADIMPGLSTKEDSAAYKLALALTLANAAYDALMVLDDQFRIIAINDAAENLFRCSRPIGQAVVEVTGSADLQTMVADAVTNAEEMLEEQLAFNGRTYKTRVQVIRRDGNTFIGIALQDISALVRLNRARRDMVANISHELRTPIANIRLIIDSLFHEQDKPKRKQSTSALKAIARETDSLLWLVQELLDLSMIETGQAILRMIEFRLRELVEEVAERMADQLEGKSLTLTIDIPEGFEVLADYDQLRRVLVNLIHNAIKWSPPGGTIEVHAEYVGDEARIDVLDTGPGVPDDQVERIFERFYQVDSSRSSGDGSGLGLAICKHIIEAHGGRIWADGNSTGGGGRFHFTVMRGENDLDS